MEKLVAPENTERPAKLFWPNKKTRIFLSIIGVVGPIIAFLASSIYTAGVVRGGTEREVCTAREERIVINNKIDAMQKDLVQLTLLVTVLSTKIDTYQEITKRKMGEIDDKLE